MKRPNQGNMFSFGDWRQALKTPHVYRVGNSILRVQNYNILCIAVILMTLWLLFTYMLLPSVCTPAVERVPQSCSYYKYNYTYPMMPSRKTSTGTSYRIAIVSDADKESKVFRSKPLWQSHMKTGTLISMHNGNEISVIWDSKDILLTSSFSSKDRGMELSELATFDGKLLTFDDCTGLVYHVIDNQIYPWIILMEGDGRNTKGFKSEWATIKDQHLYVGSIGKEWTTAAGEFEHSNPMWVKVISPQGETHSLNWISNYKRLRQAADIEFPGYMIHEAGAWSDVHRSWFFLPRRCSKDRYNDTRDEVMSCNLILTADENFINVKVTTVGDIVPVRGFSSFKFLPNSNDNIIVALKTEEFRGNLATYITAFTIDGKIILPDLKVADNKFEGFEFT